MPKDLGQKPTWHSDKSWEIESLDWKNDQPDFEMLCAYVSDRITNELSARGRKLEEFISVDELRTQVRNAACEYSERHHIIGIATHVTLWIRAVVGQQMRRLSESGNQPKEPGVDS